MWVWGDEDVEVGVGEGVRDVGVRDGSVEQGGVVTGW